MTRYTDNGATFPAILATCVAIALIIACCCAYPAASDKEAAYDAARLNRAVPLADRVDTMGL